MQISGLFSESAQKSATDDMSHVQQVIELFCLFFAVHIESLMKHDRYLSAHYRYYVREVRILAYNQLLESYSSLTLEYLATTFGVTVEFIDQ